MNRLLRGGPSVPGRMRMRVTAVALTVSLVYLGGLSRASAATPTVVDSWGAIGTFRTADGWYASPVHAAMLPDGRVLFIGVARPAAPPTTASPSRRVSWIFTPPAVGAAVPAQITISELTQPVALDSATVSDEWVMNDDLECNGAAHDAYGNVVTAGGTRAMLSRKDGGTVVFGLPYLTSYGSGRWVRTKAMLGVGPGGTTGRWYPTVTRLPNRSLLITGGLEQIDLRSPTGVTGVANLSVERFDPATGNQEMMDDRAQTPDAIAANDYTHVFVLPYPDAPRDVLMIGQNGFPVYASSTLKDSFVNPGSGRPGSVDPLIGVGSSTVQLPLRVQNGEWGYADGSILVVSGNMHTPAEHTADLFDPTTARWRSGSVELDTPRHHPSTVLLPDGRILVVNGHDMEGGLGVQNAQYIDPRRNLAVTTGSDSSGVIRGYHSVALLLPDGRVLTAGGRDQVKDTSLEKPTYQIYTPNRPAGAAPRLIDVPATVGYDKLFQVSSVGPEPAEIVLVGLGSMTHSFDMDQREIQLPIGKTFTNAAGDHLSIVGSPQSSHRAPPGFYWMFGVSAAGVSSTAKLIMVG